ncbi:MAG: O-antigen ligase family protein [Steroidobacteraceae bacterium]
MKMLRTATAVPAASAPRPQSRGKDKLLLLSLVIAFVIVFMVVPEGLDYEATKNGMPASGSTLTKLLWLCFLGIGVIKMNSVKPAVKKVLYDNRYLVGLVILSGMSYLWSIEPGVTMRRMIRILAITAICAAYAASMFNPRSFQSALRPVLTVLLIGSIVFALTLPEYGIEQLDLFELAGAWKGMTTQKNALGTLASLATLLWMHALISRQSGMMLSLVGIGVSVTCLVNSRSSTSIISTVFAAVLMLMLMRSPGSLKRFMPYLVGIFVSIILLYSMAILHIVSGLDFLLTPITSITGKDLTFSGRTDIWDILNEYMSARPLVGKLLGSGYGAYWIGDVPESPSHIMMVKLEFYPTEAHNGYLDVLNDLGWVGEFLLIGYIILFLRQALRLYGLDRAQGALFLVLLFHQLITNLTEAVWFNVRGVLFIIVTLTTMCLSRCLQLQLDARNASAPRRAPAAAAARMPVNPFARIR